MAISIALTPMITERIGYRLTSLIYGALALAVMLYCFIGCREPMEDGKNGFLVPVKDIAALADRMCRFIDEPELIGQMGSVSRAYAEEKYDSRSVNAEMLRHMRI